MLRGKNACGVLGRQISSDSRKILSRSPEMCISKVALICAPPGTGRSDAEFWTICCCVSFGFRNRSLRSDASPMCARAPVAGRRGGRVDEEREVQYHISYKDLDYFKKHFLIFLFKFCVRNHSGLNIRQTKISCAIGAGGSLQVAGKSGAVESSFSFGSTMALCGTFQLLSYTDVKANY